MADTKFIVVDDTVIVNIENIRNLSLDGNSIRIFYNVSIEGAYSNGAVFFKSGEEARKEFLSLKDRLLGRKVKETT